MRKQKFFRGQRVHIGKMPCYMKHFEGDVDAIIIGSYSDIYYGNNVESFSVLVLSKKNGNHSCAWYEEDQLTLISDNRRQGEQLLQKYKER